ncbi:MAG: bifunctional tetrahydrofolate synthase/dihydrofolate synthase [Gammaproteobacteria bacterium]|nr:bifunctional tetrahydrofolate synthase/dihydrofolate synthase [Gammaproteobacteria bacterium]
MVTPPVHQHWSVEQWLAWQQQLHPAVIELGLERVNAVYHRLQLPRLPAVITVAGTNGKGSCVAYLDAMLRAAGYRVGSYTSPHLLRYNERITVNGEMVGDEALCQAFAAVEAARGTVPLTYFEFGTLAALQILAAVPLDVIVLEVGLGGRLDAVNIVDAEVAVITSIDLDHTDWLGPDRDSIAGEKAGIMRPGRPVVSGDPAPPARLAAEAERRGARLLQRGNAFGWRRQGHQHWEWFSDHLRMSGLPLPALAGPFQLDNAATAIMAAFTLAQRHGLHLEQQHIEQGLRAVMLTARCQHVAAAPDVMLDVGHNPHAARAIALHLAERPARGRTRAVVAMLADKDYRGYLQALSAVVDDWYPAQAACPRAAAAARLRQVLTDSGHTVHHSGDEVMAACQRALAEAAAEDRVIICGSFYTVAEALPALRQWVSRRQME